MSSILIGAFDLVDGFGNQYRLTARRGENHELCLMLVSKGGTPNSLSNLQCPKFPPAFCEPRDADTLRVVGSWLRAGVMKVTAANTPPLGATKSRSGK